MKKITNSPVVTEKYLDARFDEFKTDMQGEFTTFREEIRTEVRETISAAMSKLYTRIDPLLVELEDRRLDREITTEQLRNLDKRVTKLENPN
jgi:BMFP domain-containing protein YqiC